MTYKQLQDRVASILGLQDDTTAPERVLVQDWIYEGINDILARTRPNVRVINLTVTADTPVHDLSNTVISLLDLEDEVGFLKRFSREDAIGLQRAFHRGYAYEEPLLWLSPVATADKTIRAYGVFRPTRMTADGDLPSNPSFGGLADEFHPTIITYACWKGGEYTEHEQSGGGERWRLQYEGQDGKGGEIAKIKTILAKRVSPAGARRRSPVGQTGALHDARHYVGG